MDVYEINEKGVSSVMQINTATLLMLYGDE